MKKLLSFLIVCVAFGLCIPAFADEIEEDYLDIASSYCVMGNYDAAMEYLDKIIAKNPDNKQVADLKRGLSHIISQDKKTFVSSVNPSIKKAQEYKRQGNEKMEYASLIEGTEGDNSYLAFYYLGNFYRDRNEFAKAIDAYNSSLSARSQFAQSYLALAITLYEEGKYESALNPIDKYLTIMPDDDLAYAVKSRIEFQLGMFEQAEIDNNKALSINDCPEYRFDKAKILYKSGDFKNAKDLFSEILPDIQTSKIYEYMGYCDYELKDYMSALNNIDKALILSNDDEYLENFYNEIKRHLENNNG